MRIALALPIALLALTGCNSEEQDAINAMNEQAEANERAMEEEFGFLDNDEPAPLTPLAPHLGLSELEDRNFYPAWERRSDDLNEMDCQSWQSDREGVLMSWHMEVPEVEDSVLEAFYDDVC
jgi:hypothetical protein